MLRLLAPVDETEGGRERRSSVVSVAHSEISVMDISTKKPDGNESVKSYVIQQQLKNYYKSVSENKEIAKLASLLSTSINSNKKVGLRMNLFLLLSLSYHLETMSKASHIQCWWWWFVTNASEWLTPGSQHTSSVKTLSFRVLFHFFTPGIHKCCLRSPGAKNQEQQQFNDDDM